MNHLQWLEFFILALLPLADDYRSVEGGVLVEAVLLGKDEENGNKYGSQQAEARECNGRVHGVLYN